jgi:hypothetical protein
MQQITGTVALLFMLLFSTAQNNAIIRGTGKDNNSQQPLAGA